MSARGTALLLLAITPGCASLWYGPTQEVRIESATPQTAILRGVYDLRWPRVDRTPQTLQLPATVKLARCVDYELELEGGGWQSIAPEVSVPVLLGTMAVPFIPEIVDTVRGVCPRRYPAIVQAGASEG